MPLHGTCFIGAGMTWSFIAIFAQQSPVMVCVACPQSNAIKRADGVA
jgi:hypothetical protein